MSDDETVYAPEDRAEGFPPPEGEDAAEATRRIPDAAPPGGEGAPGAADALGPTRVMEAAEAGAAEPATRAGSEEPGDAASSADATRVLTPEERSSVPPAAAGGVSTVYGEEPPPPRAVAEAVPPEAGVAEPASRQLPPGTVLFGEYEIVDVLGAGGMGEVYRARHRRLGEMRAIKVMHGNMARDPTAAEFFDREAKALLSVRHDAVVHCHDLLSDDEGRVYLVMEMIDGISLADRLRTGGALGEDEVRTLARRIGSGLDAAHRRGVIHRDLSPDNVILPGGRSEEAKLIDFGIAKVLAAGQETILEGFKGKLAYASPEQLGFFEGRIDGRSDIYSLGLLLYAAATGRALAMGSSVVDAVDARRQLAGVPADCPESLRPAIEKLVSLHPDDRPATVEGLFAADTPAAVAPRLAGGRVLRWAGGLALAGLAALAVVELRPQPQLDAEPVAVRPVAVDAEPAEVAPSTPREAAPPEEPKPSPPRRDRKADARTRLRVMGLLRGAQSALERDALMSPPGENAYEKYREVLSIDPRNREARNGVRAVADRYIALARRALERGAFDEADAYLRNARTAAPRHPDLDATAAALSERRAGG